MPKVGAPQSSGLSRALRASADPRTAFERRFQRSKKKGNLWCLHGSLSLTVYKRRSDDDDWTTYGWSIADADGPRFSEGSYETEGAALAGLWAALGGGGCSDEAVEPLGW